MFTMFGLVALTGVIVNDSIVLVDFINHNVNAGAPLYEALLEAGRRRFRPVILTSVTDNCWPDAVADGNVVPSPVLDTASRHVGLWPLGGHWVGVDLGPDGIWSLPSHRRTCRTVGCDPIERQVSPEHPARPMDPPPQLDPVHSDLPR